MSSCSGRCSWILRRSFLMWLSTVRSDDALVLVHRVHQLFAREDAPGPRAQHLEQLVLHGGQAQVVPGDGGAPGGVVQLQAMGQVVGRGLHRVRAAPQHRLHARHHLARAEGLADVVVGPEFEPEQAVDLLHARRDHDDGWRLFARRAGAQGLADVQPALAGQHQVQQHQVHRVVFQPVLHLVAAREVVRVEAGLLQVVQQHAGDLVFVLDDEDAAGHHAALSHARLPCSGAARCPSAGRRARWPRPACARRGRR